MDAREHAMIQTIASMQNLDQYRELHWTGSLEDYLRIVKSNPQVCRNAFQRLYDMIISRGQEEYIDNKKRLVRYHFFKDEFDKGRDAVYGLDIPLMRLVHVMRAAAEGYGPEKRVVLLHGPVGSSKSTIVRLLKKGLEEYSRTADGALYTFSWVDLAREGSAADEVFPCPMHEDPLHVIPLEFRPQVMRELGLGTTRYPIHVEGDLCPACRWIYNDLLRKFDGRWDKVVSHVRVRRIVLSEKDRIGIGTFQPKDEKNQDSTELTGDINYRKIAEYGSDSDPRAFNFDGEFNIANRGLVEFIEVLKLDVAFLYDLLGASQEHKIKPKKFSQTDIDEVIIGHSVAGDTPVPHLEDGVLQVEAIEVLHGKDPARIQILAYDLEAKDAVWVPIRSVFRHRFTGSMVRSIQKWGVVETTPNHSIYDVSGEPFFPHDRREMLAIRRFVPPEPLRAVVLEIPGTVEVDGMLHLADRSHPHDSKSAALGWKARYDVSTEERRIRDLLRVLAWYVTEGHSFQRDRVEGKNTATSGVVISNADPRVLRDLVAAADGLYTGQVYVQEMDLAKHGAHRLYLSSALAHRVLTHLCGEKADGKTFPDFVLNLPDRLREFFFEELVRGDGTRRTHLSDDACTQEYREAFFEYRTASTLLATKVGVLLASLGIDFSQTFWDRTAEGKLDSYRLRYVNPRRRHHRFTAQIEERPAQDEWVYDIECVGHHNFVCGVGNVVCHNTNEAEYKKLLSNEFMEALRDRTIKIDIPYITKLAAEVKIYQKDFSARRITGKHIAPHTLEVAAMWAILTRLEDPKKHNLTLMQKLKLYDGKTLPGFTQDNVKELRKESKREGMEGISPRYIQDKISNALVRDVEGCLNPFMVMNELDKGLRHHSLIASEDVRRRYSELVGLVKREYEEIVKNEVQRAISADEDAITKLAANYIDNIKAYTLKERVKNRYTGQDDEPDERLMRSIEEKIDIPESRKDDFRREIMNYIGALAVDGKTFEYHTNDRLRRALELKLFEDQKDSIKLTSMVSAVVDRDTQEKIDVVKNRMIKNYGYCEICSTDVLNFVASIFARGDVKD